VSSQEREEVLSEATSRVRQLEAERHTEAASLAKAEVRWREAERAAETTVRVLEQQVYSMSYSTHTRAHAPPIL